MIHHVSIPVTDTSQVIGVLQELLGGVITEFGPYRDSWILWTGDDHGTAIEVYPVGTEMYPPDGPGQALFRESIHPSPFVATHATVSLNRTVQEIQAIAAAHGWRAERLSRGPFDVVEFWIENHVMLELMTPDMEEAYLTAAPHLPASRDAGEPE